MAQDLKLAQNSNKLFDLVVDGSNFATVDGLQTAIIVSLFTDRRAPESAVSDPARRRGWVGNIVTAQTGRELGSLLWLYEQSRLTQKIKNAIVAEAESALAWMVEDGVAASVSASILAETLRGIFILIEILTPQGETRNYSLLWRDTNASGF